MPTIRLTPSTYSVSSNTLSVSNANNMYDNTDSSTYSTASTSTNNTTSYYIYLKGFNFDSIPSNATINSFTVKIKAYEKSLSTSSSYAPKLCNNTTTITGSCSAVTTSASVSSFTGVTASWDTIKGYGSNFAVRFTYRRSSRNTKGYLYIYGAEILVDYTIPQQLKVKRNGAWTNVSKVYKKVNGSWVQQTSLSDLFDETTKYVNGD